MGFKQPRDFCCLSGIVFVLVLCYIGWNMAGTALQAVTWARTLTARLLNLFIVLCVITWCGGWWPVFKQAVIAGAGAGLTDSAILLSFGVVCSPTPVV